MPFKLVAPKAGRWANYRVRGTQNGLYLDRSTGVTSRRDAIRILNEWKAEAQRTIVSGSGRRLSFAEAAIAYMEAGGEKRFLAPLLKHFGNSTLADIGQGHIDAAAACLYPNATSATRNRQVYSPISAILKHSGVEKPLKRPKGSQGTPRLTWLRPEEAMRLLDAAEAVDVRFGALCTFLLYTGCRLSEALRLKWSEVSLDEGFAYVGKTKNGSPRAVHLPEVAVKSLALLPNDARTVFRLSKCGRLYTMLNRAAVDAGYEIPDGIAFHIFRHTYGSYLRRYGGLDTSGLVATGAWKSRQAASIYEHVEVTDSARRSDLFPVRKPNLDNEID